MRRVGLLAVAAGAALVAGSASAQPRVITRPDWLERPSAQAFADHYPKLAEALEIEGFTQITCEVTEKGRLQGCKIDIEGPKAFGFGRAAIAISGAFRMRPGTVDGEPVSGAVVCIPIRFVLPPPTPAAPTPAVTPEIRAAALQIVEVQAAAVEKAQEEELAALVDSPDADEATRQAAANAVRASAKRHAARLRQELADALIGALSPDEIQALNGMTVPAAGRAARERLDMTRLAPEISSRASAYLFEEIRTAFCGLSPCAGSAAELAAVAAAAAPPTVEVEHWARTPSARAHRVAAPSTANLLGVSGSARLTCEAGEDGALKTCAVAAEAPAGWKYGQAALRLMKDYRLDPAPDGAAGHDRSVTLRVRFTATPTIPVERPPAAPSPKAKALARKLVDVSEPQAMVAAQMPSFVSSLTREVGPAMAPHVEAAIRAGVPRAIERMLDDLSDLVATASSETELAAMVDLFASPAGKSLAAKAPGLEASVNAAVRRSQALVAADARAEFCAARDCAAPQAQTATSPEPSTLKP